MKWAHNVVPDGSEMMVGKLSGESEIFGIDLQLNSLWGKLVAWRKGEEVGSVVGNHLNEPLFLALSCNHAKGVRAFLMFIVGAFKFIFQGKSLLSRDYPAVFRLWKNGSHDKDNPRNVLPCSISARSQDEDSGGLWV